MGNKEKLLTWAVETSCRLSRQIDLPIEVMEDISPLDGLGLQVWVPKAKVAIGYFDKKVWQIRFVEGAIVPTE